MNASDPDTQKHSGHDVKIHNPVKKKILYLITKANWGELKCGNLSVYHRFETKLLPPRGNYRFPDPLPALRQCTI